MENQPKQISRQPASIVGLCLNLWETIEKLDAGIVSAETAQSKARLANAYIRGATVLLMHERLKNQNRINSDIRLISDKGTPGK